MKADTHKSNLSSARIEKKLLQAGIQPTAQRIAVCKYVFREGKHATAEEVKRWADKNFPKISLATIYNTLNTLVEAGLLKETRFPHTDKVAYDNNIREHYHFVDEETGEVIDIEPGSIRVESRLNGEFRVRSVDVVFYGTKK